MGRLSRGCLRCRQRRVRCDEGRPSCRRCIHRNEVCEGYRDESSLIFRHETDKVIGHSRATQAVYPPSSQDSSYSSARKRNKSVGASSTSRELASVSRPNADPSALAPEEASAIKLSNRHPWLKGLPARLQPPVEEQAVDQFMDRYIIYPCNQTSSPGFLEHLPCMFKEANVEGRYALRWAVRAAAYADVSKDQESNAIVSNALVSKALQCYGMALGALGESLSTPGKVPDDYDLMTVVVLDIFEVGL
jgi:Fungal Zn(2)-Cys(6) binuclear cluster domain